MKKIYLCHDFDGIYDNAKKIIDYIDKLFSFNNNALYITPILLFGSLFDLNNNIQERYRLSLLKDCELLLDFNEDSISDICLREKRYCICNNIPIVNYIDYCKQYFNLQTGVDKDER